ncbi:uncharacterized protein KZ484_003343 [Pholidichthys leucotaenia]
MWITPSRQANRSPGPKESCASSRSSQIRQTARCSSMLGCPAAHPLNLVCERLDQDMTLQAGFCHQCGVFLGIVLRSPAPSSSPRLSYLSPPSQTPLNIFPDQLHPSGSSIPGGALSGSLLGSLTERRRRRKKEKKTVSPCVLFHSPSQATTHVEGTESQLPSDVEVGAATQTPAILTDGQKVQLPYHIASSFSLLPISGSLSADFCCCLTRGRMAEIGLLLNTTPVKKNQLRWTSQQCLKVRWFIMVLYRVQTLILRPCQQAMLRRMT